MPPRSAIARPTTSRVVVGIGEVDAVGTRRRPRRHVAATAFDVDVDQGELGALATERGGDLGADAAGRAGDHRAAAGEPAGRSTGARRHGAGV